MAARIADPLAPDIRRPHRAVRSVLHLALVLAAALAAIFAIPAITGATWTATGRTIAAIPTPTLAILCGLWLIGLCLHTTTLCAALPGLTRRRALTLSLTGSAVSNVLPLGGAAGVATNYRMARSWGFPGERIASYTVVTNVCNVVAKLVLPALLLPLLWFGVPAVQQMRTLVVVAAVALPAVGAVVYLGLVHPWTEGRLGRRVEAVRGQSHELLRTRWRPLAGGMACYLAALFVLLGACLYATGAHVGLAIIAVAFTGERLSTLVNLTPGGLGVVEVGLVALLSLAPTADPAGIATGVLLYRALTFGLEIPVGGLLLAGWVWRGRRVR